MRLIHFLPTEKAKWEGIYFCKMLMLNVANTNELKHQLPSGKHYVGSWENWKNRMSSHNLQERGFLWTLRMSPKRQFMYKICQYDKRDLDFGYNKKYQNKNYNCTMIESYFLGHWLSLLTIVSDVVSGKIYWSIRLSVLSIKFHRKNCFTNNL